MTPRRIVLPGPSAVDGTPDSDSNLGTLCFRDACRDDLPVLVRMLADDPLGAKRERFTDPLAPSYVGAFAAIAADPNNELIVAVLDGAVVGMLQITFIPHVTYHGRWRAMIEGVRVSTAVRARGVGSALFQWAIDRARSRNCVMVQLTADRERDDALRFYQRLGFVASHHGMKLHLQQSD